MKSITVFRSIFLSLMVSVFLLGEATAQEQRRSSGSATIKDGSATTTQPAPATRPSAPAPVYRPGPSEKQETSTTPVPIYRPAPNDREQARAPGQVTVNRNADLNGDGVISKEERKRMKEIRKAEKKRLKEIRKAEKKHAKEIRKAHKKHNKNRDRDDD